jgi:hypothetical protein
MKLSMSIDTEPRASASGRSTLLLFVTLLTLTATSFGAETYDGPRPPKPDVPYLLHADRLVETEMQQAHQESKKGDVTYSIDGTASPAKTPLAEPIFILDSKNLDANSLGLYRLDSKNGHREITMSGGGRKRRGGGRPIHVLVTPLGGHLYKIEADEHLEEGEYSLSPADSNTVFCFAVY